MTQALALGLLGAGTEEGAGKEGKSGPCPRDTEQGRNTGRDMTSGETAAPQPWSLHVAARS